MKRTGPVGFALILLLATLAPGLSFAATAGALVHSDSPSAAVPGVPSNLQVPFATNSSVRLSWQAPVSNGGSAVTNYTIYRGSSIGAESLYKVLGSTTSFVDTSLPRGTYYYKVSASNSVGEGRTTYEVGLRIGSTFTMTLGSTFIDTGQFLTSYSSQAPRSTLASTFVSVWTSNTNLSTTFSLTGVPSGTHPYPITLPFTGQGSFTFTLALVTDTGVNQGSFPLALNAAGPLGDNESIALTLNVRGLSVTPSPATVYVGQNETIVGALCPSAAQSTWANVTYDVVYQRPDGTQTTDNSSASISGGDMCAGSPALDKFSPTETGTWYARASINLVSWDGSTEYIYTQASGQQNFPPSFSISFTVANPPPKSLNVSLTALPATVQSGGTSVVKATTTASDGTSPPVTLLWSVTGGTLNSTSGNPVLWSAPQVQTGTNFFVSVIASSPGFVQGTATTTIQVLPPQGPRAAISTNSTAGFAPFTVQFRGGATSGTSPYSFAWSFGDGATSNLQNVTHVFSAAGNYTTTLTVTDSKQLSSTTSVTIRVSPKPILLVTISASVYNGTAPLTVRFSSSVTGGFPPYSYSWSFGDGSLSTNTSAVHTFLVAGKYTTILTVVDSLGITASTSVQVQVTVSTYTVTFTAVGLPPSTPWNVTFAGHSYSSSTNTISVGSVTSGSYQWSTGEVDTCKGCRFIPLLTGGPIAVPGNLSRQITFQSQFFVSTFAIPAGAGAVTPASGAWYVSGTTVTVTARPNGTMVLHSWSASNGIGLGSSSIVGGTARVNATIGGPGTITAGFADAWQGSFIRTYYGNQTWRPEIIELHFAAADTAGSWATLPATFAGTLQSSGSYVLGTVGPAGIIFGFVAGGSGPIGTPNGNGSYDFTVIQLAGGLAYVYQGLLGGGTMSSSPLGGTPIWVPLLSMPAPITDKLVFGSSILPYSSSATISQISDTTPVTVLSLATQPSGLALTVKDAQGRITGTDPQTSKLVNDIPGSFVVEVGNAFSIVLPGNVSSVTYLVDGTRASQPTVNFTVTLQSLGASGISAQSAASSFVAKGTVDTFSASLGNAQISNVQLYQVSLTAVDSLGLPAPGTTATLVASNGTSLTLSIGESKKVPGGTYAVSVNYAGRTTHETVAVESDGPISTRVSLSYYSILIIGAIVAVVGGLISSQVRRVKKTVKKRIKPEPESDWLK